MLTQDLKDALLETTCPMPEKPDWHPDATRTDCQVSLANSRTLWPTCARLKDQAPPSYCARCLREVVPWKLPEARTPSATVAPALGVTPAVADGVARRKWQR